MTVNDKICALRELNKWSQEDMAERMNMSKSSYSRLERDECKLDLSRLEKLAAVFKIDIAELVTADDKGLVLLIGANGGNNTNYYGNPEGAALELEKLNLSLSHAQELLRHKDQLIEQQNSELAALRLLVEQLQK